MGVVTIAKSDVLAIAPEFSTVSDGDFTTFIGFAVARINGTVWGATAAQAAALMCAHMLTMCRPKLGTNKPVMSESAGQVRRQYAQMAASAGDALDLSMYGLEYKRLRRQLVASQVL